jgi:hypothetical protein
MARSGLEMLCVLPVVMHICSLVFRRLAELLKFMPNGGGGAIQVTMLSRARMIWRRELPRTFN